MSTKTAATNPHTTVKPSQLLEALRFCDRAALVPFILGPAGLGKTDICRQFAHERAGEGVEEPYHPVYLGQRGPTDLAGFPYIDRETNRMRFSVPALLPTTPGTTLHFDEFTNAPKLNQNMALQITHEKRVGEWVAPERTMMILSGNGQGDRCHTERLSSALANRVMFLHLVPDLEDWSAWALKAGVDVRVVAFLRFRPDLLHTFSASSWDGETGFASPRSWAATARLVEANPPGFLRHPMLEGLIGPGPAAELNAFLATYEALPSIDGILLDPKGSEVPEDPSARYAVCAALCNRTTKGNFDRVSTYLARLPKEFEVFGVRLCYKVKKEITATRAFVQWASDNTASLT